MWLVLLTRSNTGRRKSAIKCKIGLYVRCQSGAVCKIPPEAVGNSRKQSEQIPPDQIDKRRDGRTVGRSRPAADTALSDRPPQTGSRQEIPRYISRPIPPEQSPAEIQRPANTAGTIPNDQNDHDRARLIFRARYGVGDDLRPGAARTPPELSRSALSAISKFYLISIARCDSGQLSALISANCTK